MVSESSGERRAGIVNDDVGMFGMVAQIVDIGTLKLAACLHPSRLVGHESDAIHRSHPRLDNLSR